MGVAFYLKTKLPVIASKIGATLKGNNLLPEWIHSYLYEYPYSGSDKLFPFRSKVFFVSLYCKYFSYACTRNVLNERSANVD